MKSIRNILVIALLGCAMLPVGCDDGGEPDPASGSIIQVKLDYHPQDHSYKWMLYIYVNDDDHKLQRVWFTSDVTPGEYDLTFGADGGAGWIIASIGEWGPSYWLRTAPELPFTVTVYHTDEKERVTTQDFVISAYTTH